MSPAEFESTAKLIISKKNQKRTAKMTLVVVQFVPLSLGKLDATRWGLNISCTPH